MKSPASDRIGPYKIKGEIGRGGMGVVFEAVHESLGKTRRNQSDANATDQQ